MTTETAAMQIVNRVVFIFFNRLRPVTQISLRKLILDAHSREYGYFMVVTLEDLKAAHDCVEAPEFSVVRNYFKFLMTVTMANEAELLLFDMK